MSVPLGRPSGSDAPKPTEHQLAMARVRARTTGESLAHVLSVFMGAGRNGEEPGTCSTGPEAPLADPDPDPDPDADAGPCGGTAARSGTDGEGEDPARLAPVIPLSRASRGKGGSGRVSHD